MSSHTQRRLDAREVAELDTLVRKEVRVPAKPEVRRAAVQTVTRLLATYAGGTHDTHAVVGGSEVLGVALGHDDDIDILCVVPEQVCTRAQFFALHDPRSFVATLTQSPDVHRVQCIASARVPIIKCTLPGDVDVDLLLCRSRAESSVYAVNPVRFGDGRELLSVTPDSVLSLNSVRLAYSVLHQVLDHKLYTHALCVVRLWARSRCMYGTVMGYPGGAAWCILVLCAQQHAYRHITPAFRPHERLGHLLAAVFELLAHWDWPKPLWPDVLEVGDEAVVTHLQDDVTLTPWRFWPFGMGQSDMPLLTPTYPAFNSTHTVAAPQRATLVSEAHRALRVCREATACRTPWSTLWSPLEVLMMRVPRRRLSPPPPLQPLVLVEIPAWSRTDAPLDAPLSHSVAVAQWHSLVLSRLARLTVQLHECGLCVRMLSKKFRAKSQTPPLTLYVCCLVHATADEGVDLTRAETWLQGTVRDAVAQLKEQGDRFANCVPASVPVPALHVSLEGLPPDVV